MAALRSVLSKLSKIDSRVASHERVYWSVWAVYGIYRDVIYTKCDNLNTAVEASGKSSVHWLATTKSLQPRKLFPHQHFVTFFFVYFSLNWSLRRSASLLVFACWMQSKISNNFWSPPELMQPAKPRNHRQQWPLRKEIFTKIAKHFFHSAEVWWPLIKSRLRIRSVN